MKIFKIMHVGYTDMLKKATNARFGPLSLRMSLGLYEQKKYHPRGFTAGLQQEQVYYDVEGMKGKWKVERGKW